MSKRRIKFSKTGMAKYISHLDLLRVFTRAVMRAELPVKYSNGFNPHQIITFSLPLAVGVTSESEFVDIDFDDSASNGEIAEKLGRALPPDMKVMKIGEPEISANDICSALYHVVLKGSGISRESLESFFEKEDIPAVKKTKKGEKTVNLKDYIKVFKIIRAETGEAELELVLSAGGSANIKPAIVADKIFEYSGCGDEAFCLIHRKEIYYLRPDGETAVFE